VVNCWMSKTFFDNVEGWLIVNVSYIGEQQPEEMIAQEVYDINGECEIFFPSSSEKIDNEKIIKSIMPGYIFLKASSIKKNPYLLEGSRFLDHIVTVTKNRKERHIKFVTDAYIASLKTKLYKMMFNNLQSGQKVLITKGLYSNLQGHVIKLLDSSNAIVKIELSSRTLEVEVPQVCLSGIN